jgi:hypothetical protein
MTRKTNVALALGVVLLGAAVEARADCQYLRGSISETRISQGTEPTRILGTVTGVLNGAGTVTLLSTSPVVRSLDQERLRVAGRRIAGTHPYSRRASRRSLGARRPDDHRRMGQVRRRLRHDGVRWTGSHGRSPANHRADLQGDRLRSEYQGRRKLKRRRLSTSSRRVGLVLRLPCCAAWQ